MQLEPTYITTGSPDSVAIATLMYTPQTDWSWLVPLVRVVVKQV